MKRWTLVLALLVLMGLTGCKSESEEKDIPELLEPVGVQMDLAEAKTDTIYKIETYNGKVVPYVEELQFNREGVLEELKVTIGDVVEAGQVLAVLSDEDTLEQIKVLKEDIAEITQNGEYSDEIADIDIEIAQIELEKMKMAGYSKQNLQLKEIDIQKLQLNLKQAQELRVLELQKKNKELGELQSKINNNKITAPFSGRVVYVGDLKTGSKIQRSVPVICLADESRISLETEFIMETSVNHADKVYALINGEEYHISYMPYDKKEYIETVLSGGELSTAFAVEGDTDHLECGQYASVVIMNSYKDHVLTVPANAVYSDENGHYVYKIVDGQRTRCGVAVGVLTDVKAEISDGLEEGDLVYVKE